MPKIVNICGSCQFPSKYVCPGCGAFSCSLVCVKDHKTAIGCSGKRSKTKFVPKSDMNSTTLLSDFEFLQEIKDSIIPITGKGIRLSSGLVKTFKQKQLKVKFAPMESSRRKQNQTKLVKKEIYWTIEVFDERPGSEAPVQELFHDIPESSSLRDALKIPSDDNLIAFIKNKVL